MSIIITVWALPVLIACVLLLVLGHSRRLWGQARLVCEVALGILLASSPFLLFVPLPLPVVIILAVLHAALVVIAIRPLFGRLGPPFMQASIWTNVLAALSVGSVAVFGAWVFQEMGVSNMLSPIFLLSGVLLFVMLWMLAQILWTLIHYKLRFPDPTLLNRELPTVSICIPARNETHALVDCLTAALASDYPKLEILVLDDCSQDKTSQIIRSFAHDGVRFIQGDLPADDWLGRNQALHTLAQHASGSFIVFMGVDTRLAPQSVSMMVRYMVTHKLKMTSVLPQYSLGVAPGTVLNTLSSFWQIVRPVSRRHMPVSSKCWMISAATLRELGGMASVRQKIMPEESFARRVAITDAYRFIVGNAALGVTEGKRWSSQIETSIRIVYPMLKRQPVYALLGALCLLVFGLGPFILTAVLLITPNAASLLVINCLTLLLFALSYALVVVRTHPKSWPLAIIALPFVVIQEAVIICVSMLRYEFGTVNWKGRNVCYPVIAQSAQSARRSVSFLAPKN